jgi:hypothetical protein
MGEVLLVEVTGRNGEVCESGGSLLRPSQAQSALKSKHARQHSRAIPERHGATAMDLALA